MAPSNEMQLFLATVLLWIGTIGGLMTLDLSDPDEEPEPEPFVSQAEAELDRVLRQATSITGVRFRYVDLEEERIANRGMLPLEHALLEPHVKNVVAELLRYPEALRRELIGEVAFYDTLYDGQIEWGGRAVCRDEVIQLSLTSNGPEENIRRSVVHHEIAHLAWCAADFPRKRWLAVSGDRYLGRDQKVAVTKEVGNRLDPELFEAGFLSRYGQTEGTEDLAVFAEYVLIMPLAVDSAASRHERIRDKRDLLVDYYTARSPGWDLWIDHPRPIRSSSPGAGRPRPGSR